MSDVDFSMNADGDITAADVEAESLPGLLCWAKFGVQCLECGKLIDYQWTREDLDEGMIQFEVECASCSAAMGRPAVIPVSIPVGEQADMVDELVESTLAEVEAVGGEVDDGPAVSSEGNASAESSVEHPAGDVDE